MQRHNDYETPTNVRDLTIDDVTHDVAAVHARTLQRLCTPAAARTKRLLEWWSADEEFRELLRSDVSAVNERLGCVVDADAVQFARELVPGARWPIADIESLPTPVRDYLTFRAEKERFGEAVRIDGEPANPRWAAWRRRQIQRCELTLQRDLSRAIVHPVFACELSDGCSVGCWFCGVSAPRLASHFNATEANRQLWIEMLRALKHTAGERAGRWGFLYWASDPFDNPSYEEFCAGFAAVFGMFPHTTTAQALKDVDRTRAFLQLSNANGCMHNRFSVLSIGALRRISQAFTAEELGMVELVIQTRDSVLQKQRAGRALASAERARRHDDADGGTIACVSGFLISAPKRTVQLISPCGASARWPLGYRVHAMESFDSGDDFRDVIERMIDEHMPTEVRDNQLVKLVDGVTYRQHDRGFILSAHDDGIDVSGHALLPELGDWICRGTASAGEIAAHFQNTYGVDHDVVYGWLNRIFEHGYIDDDPADVAARTPVGAIPA